MFIQSNVNGQEGNDSFYFYYSFAGLGSNMGSMQPTITISETNLIYTFEQNSFFGEATKRPDTLLITTVRQSSIDSIVKIIGELKDTTIYQTNPCIMSGGIHRMTISSKGDTTNFTMHNTFHRNALKISEIVNQYLPIRKNIWATEQYIIDGEECWAEFEKRRKNGGK